jgi:hypothetical protein
MKTDDNFTRWWYGQWGPYSMRAEYPVTTTDAAKMAWDARQGDIDDLRHSLRAMIDLAEYWISRELKPDMSREDYESWLSLGYNSKALRNAYTILKDTK